MPVSQGPNSDEISDMVMRQAGISALISIGITTAVMMAVPFVCRIVKKQKLDYVDGRSLCKWNSIGLFVLSLTMTFLKGWGLVGGLGALIYYFINKWIFVDDPPQPKFLTEETQSEEANH